MRMREHSKGVVIVLGPEDGDSFWQLSPSTGYVINNITPYNSLYDAFSIGSKFSSLTRIFGDMPTSAAMSCCSATGATAAPRSKTSAINIAEETIIFIGRGLQHKVMNTGAVQMRLLWSIAPSGLEDWFRPLGDNVDQGTRRRRHWSAPPTSRRSRRSSGSSSQTKNELSTKGRSVFRSAVEEIARYLQSENAVKVESRRA